MGFASDETVRAVRSAAPELAAWIADLVRVPSVSSDPVRRNDVRRAAHLVQRLLRHVGLPEVRCIQTAGHPVVIGRWPYPGRPTVLVYGHYDVQAADPSGWSTAPFRPVQRGAWLYGRGTTDNKGQLLTHLAAVAAWTRTAGRPPVGVVVVADGEEEIGSPHLPPVIERLAPHVDAAVISDMTMPGQDEPAITESLRGKLSIDVRVSNRGVAAHSGLFGGAVADPGAWLCWVLGDLHEADGSVAVEGFYDAVRQPPHARIRARPDGAIRSGAGGATLWPEAGYTADEATTIRPALVVASLASGSVGTRAAAVVPSSASARLDLRLVLDQRPEQIASLVVGHIRALAPPELDVTVKPSIGASPVRFDREHPVTQAAVRALRAAFGRDPVWVRSGGTIPVAATLHRRGVPCVVAGFGLPSARLHGPDERVHLPTLLRGAEFSARWMGEIGARSVRAGRPPRVAAGIEGGSRA